MMRRRLTGAFVALAAGAALAVVSPPATAQAATFNVKDYGAKGNGSTVDSPAIDKAIAAASAAGGGIVDFPPGTYLVPHDPPQEQHHDPPRAGSKIIASGSGMDGRAEPVRQVPGLRPQPLPQRVAVGRERREHLLHRHRHDRRRRQAGDRRQDAERCRATSCCRSSSARTSA